MNLYICRFCFSKLDSVKSYLSHYSSHKNVKNLSFPCCYEFCNRNFVKFTSLKSHITRDHKYLSQKPELDQKFVCCIENCLRKFDSLKELLSHLKSEISSEQPIPCPYLNCNGSFTKHSSLTSHISRKHKIPQADFKHLFRQNISSFFDSVADDSESHIQSFDEHEVLESVSDLSKLFTQSLALFYMKLEAINLVSVKTIDGIVSDTADLHIASNKILKKQLEHNSKISKELESLSTIQNLIDQDEFSKKTFGKQAIFDTNFKRKRFYSKHFSYVKPIEMYLGLDENNKKCIYHYVPLKESLNFLLQDKSVIDQINDPLKTEENIFSDVQDGFSFQNNVYFKNNKDALKLVIYQDAYEVVNPLGSAKKTYKLLGFYFTLLDIYPCHRSKIDPLQLLLLCRERDFVYFGNGKSVLERLIRDIKELSVGVFVNGNFVKANVACILGDNLGSHFIGGFCTNFSNEQYFCRYCLMTKSCYQDEPLSIRFASERTIENYTESIDSISDNISHYNGIKFNSLFNDLSGFHVSNGLPPCLGHDLLEGVIKYDLALYLKNLMSVKKWFDIHSLNYLISSYVYKSPDLENKPVAIKEKCDNIGGHAVQIWTLLRLLPSIILNYVKDPHDEYWHAILLLRLITEYICASKISLTQICFLHQLLDDYMSERCRLFPNISLRPKHHYVHHYPYLILKFGPLIRVWTMRFESKHSYFKHCIRSSKNFKNVTKTLSEKHQLLQSYYAVGNLFSINSALIESSVEFSRSNVGSYEMYHYICQNLDVCNLRISSELIKNHFSIKAGHCIIISALGGYIGFAQVNLFLVSETEELNILCRFCQTDRSINGLYEVSFETGDLKILYENDVLDWSPLVVYGNTISLKNYPLEC